MVDPRPDPFENADTAVAQLTHDLRELAEWCFSNSLLINSEKTKLLLLGTPQMLVHIPDNFSVTLLGKDIRPSHSAKDLIGDGPGFASDVQ